MTLTVLKRAAKTALTTLENFRLDTGGKMGSPSDPQVERMIKQASSTVARYCQRSFGRQLYRQTIYSIPCEGFVLDAGPQVNRIISVSIAGGAAYGQADYRLEDGALRLTYGGAQGAIGDGSAYNLYRSLQPALVVDYEAGWLLPGEGVGADFTGDTPLPDEVEKAVIQLASVALSEAGRDFTVKQEAVEGIGSKTFYVQGSAAQLPHPGAEAALQPYRRLVLV